MLGTGYDTREFVQKWSGAVGTARDIWMLRRDMPRMTSKADIKPNWDRFLAEPSYGWLSKFWSLFGYP